MQLVLRCGNEEKERSYAAAGQIGGADGFKRDCLRHRAFACPKRRPRCQSLPMTVPREPCGEAPPKLVPPIGLSETKVEMKPGEFVVAAFQIVVSRTKLLRR